MTNPTNAAKEFSVFFAWQSDLATEATTNRFRAALRAAAKNLSKRQLKGAAIRVEVDEATRGAAGSPNIPLLIQAKLRAADVVVADITPVTTLGKKGLPNPNVGFELGFAVGLLGWDRVVLLFNTAFGSFPAEVPFDFDRHRIMRVAFPPRGGKTKARYDAATRESDEDFRRGLEHALWSIIEQDPARPAKTVAPTVQEIKRERDLNTLRLIASRIHVPTLQRHVHELPRRIWDDVEVHLAMFDDVYLTPLHYLYDEKARDLVSDFRKAWGDTFARDSYFDSVPNREYAVFQTPGDVFVTDAAKRAWDFLEDARGRLAKAMHALFDHLRAVYPEIDIEAASNEALRTYKSL